MNEKQKFPPGAPGKQLNIFLIINCATNCLRPRAVEPSYNFKYFPLNSESF